MFKLPGATYPMEPFIPMELRELTEASVTSPHVLSQKNVTWLEIAMDDGRLATIVKVVQSIHKVNRDV
jgi:hypothetical protein